MRNNQVTASSMVDSPERRAAQAALAPPPAPQPSTTATAPAPVAGFQSAAQRLGTLPAPGQTQLGYQPRRYADGGTVQDEERAQRLAQLPSGEGNETRAAFGFYPQLAGGQRTSYATDQKLRSGVVATGPSTFEPAVDPAPPAPPAPVGGGDGRRMGATQDPRSLTFAGSSAPAPAPSSDGALGRAAAMASNLPAQTPAPQTGGPVSPQNESAASALTRRGAEEAMALMPNAPQLDLRAPTVRHSGNDWASRKQLENLATAASSITNDQRWGGDGDKSLDRQALAQAQATDAVLQQAQPGLEAAAMRENADNMRAQMQARSAAAQAQSAERGAMDRTLITERGNNTRAGITALAGIEEARIKNNEGKPLTEDQAKSAGYALRMDNALKLINDIGSKDKSAVRPGVVSGLTNMLPEGAANMLRPEARQRVESAQLDALDAALTLNTGAAYTREQLQGLSRSYFAQPGDDDRTVADKQNRLNSLIQTARLRAGTKGSAMADSVQAKAAQQGGAQAQPVATQEAYAALPSGSRFVAPDGKVRIKP